MTNHWIENGRRELLLTVAGGIAGLAVGSLAARVLAQPASGPPLSISTIGAGREGGALGALFVKAGHRVMFSSRHPDTLKGLVDELGQLARVGTVAEAVDFGDVVMVVVPYTAMEQIGRDYGNALAKKVLVIDVSNPIARRDGDEIVKWVDDHGGAGLATAKYLGAHVVRAFNAIGYAKLSADAHRQENSSEFRSPATTRTLLISRRASSERLVLTPSSSGDWRWANIWFPERRSAASIRRQKSGRS
jgi:8-hydroxy-5-deazaflavin:NADPH oxidoreductase